MEHKRNCMQNNKMILWMHTMLGPVNSKAAPDCEPRLTSVGMGDEEDVATRAGCHRSLHSSSGVSELQMNSGKQVAPPSCCAKRARAASTSKLDMATLILCHTCSTYALHCCYIFCVKVMA